MKCPARGLYAITQTENKTIATVLAEVEAALAGGVIMVQYRDKNPIDAFLLASELVKLCHPRQIPVIINDHIDLAIAVGAAGVHLGKEDGDISAARKRLGAAAIIGVSCYNSIERAINAQQQGASYVAFGRFFTSTSKPLAAPAELITLQQAKLVINIPIVAIGGINADNGGQLVNAGADLLAVIGGLFNTDSPEEAARSFQKIF